MNNPLISERIEQSTRRAYRHFYEDGLVEITVGALFLGVALLVHGFDQARRGSWWQVILGIALPVLVVSLTYFARQALARVKEEVTYPRSGFVSIDPDARTRGRLLVMFSGLLLAIISFFLPDGMRQISLAEGALLAVVLIYIGWRIRLRRFYLVAAVTFGLGLVAALYLPGDSPGTSFTFGGTGLLMILMGTFAFLTFLRQYPRADGEL